MEKLLSFNDYYEDKYLYTINPKNGAKFREDNSPNDIRNFFKTRGTCPFCESEAKLVFEGTLHMGMNMDLFENTKIWECLKCGWWEEYTNCSEETDFYDGNTIKVQQICTDLYHYGIVKKYDIDDKQLPIGVLLNELRKKKELLCYIAPYKLEEFVKFVLEDFFACEVKHVGKTGDGGIDLLVIQADKPILVQVKRRENKDHIELVKGIREFIGTMFIEDSKKGIYVSTANDFSKGSKEVANKLIQNRKLHYFELIDYNRLISMLQLEKKSNNKPWLFFTKNYEQRKSCYTTQKFY